MKQLNEITLILFCIIGIVFLIKHRMDRKKGQKKDEEGLIDEFVNKHSKVLWGILLLLIFISRIYQFGILPAYVGVDEAAAAYDGYALAEYGVDRYLLSYPVYLINFGGGQSALYAYLVAGFIKLFGTELWVYRLPSLLIFIGSIFACYFMVKRAKDQKTAFLFAFLIIIFPWHIMSSRFGLDCNLLFGLLSIDLYLLTVIKNIKGYIFTGFMIGLTLYTYCLSYLILPIFLLLWLAYEIYLKKITIKQILSLGIPIFILALPLMYMIILNNGWATQTTFGWITVPKLLEYRQNEIAISNIWNHGIETIIKIFLSRDVLYFIQLPFFLIGLLTAIKETKKSMQEKKWSLSAVMLILFLAVLLTMLMIEDVNANKANAIYIPFLYFVTEGILALCKRSAVSMIVMIGTFIILFVNYEVYYYMNFSQSAHHAYEEKDLYEIADWIENDETLREYDKYILAPNTSRPEIYFMLAQKISPYEFDHTKQIHYYKINDKNGIQIIIQYDKHYFSNVQEAVEKIKQGEKEIIIIIDESYQERISELQQEDLQIEKNGKFMIVYP